MIVLRDKKRIIFLLVILLIAAFFRLWQLDSIPPGLHPDEAANGQDALLILKGYNSPFFERGQGREALYYYLLAGSIGLFGVGIWQIHLVSALIGILTVIFTWFLAKKLFNRRVAFFAAFFLAGSAWHTTLSRTGFRAILIPLLSTLFFYFTYLTLNPVRDSGDREKAQKESISNGVKETSKKKSRIFAVLSGISFGLGFYTYIPFRMMLAIVGFLMVVILLTNRRIYKYFWREIIISFFSAVLTLLPLIIYFIKNPAFLVGRSGAVSIFNPELNQGNLIGTFWEVLKKTFWMFFTNGDLNWRHNVSGFSVLDPLVSSLFLIGFFISLLIIIQRFIKIRTYREKLPKDYFKYLLLIVWFSAMLVPEVLSAEGIPHSLRAIGVIPVVFFFSAIAIDFFWKKISFVLKSKSNKMLLGTALGLILAATLLYNYNLYFGISINSPGFHYAYRGDLTIVSNYLNERNLKEKTYLALDDYSVQTVDFLTVKNNQPYNLVNPWDVHQIELKPGDQIIFAQETIFDLEKQTKIFDTKNFEKHHPETELIMQGFNQLGEKIMKIYDKLCS